MYKPKDRDTYVLFPELFPFGGRLDERNRWLQISKLIPWPELEGEYLKYFSSVGRPPAASASFAQQRKSFFSKPYFNFL